MKPPFVFSAEFENLFRMYEGSACCADKTGTVLRSIAMRYVCGKPIVFDFAGKYTYHLPSKILRTEAEILACFHALYRLYYGNPAEYLQFLHSLAEIQS